MHELPHPPEDRLRNFPPVLALTAFHCQGGENAPYTAKIALGDALRGRSLAEMVRRFQQPRTVWTFNRNQSVGTIQIVAFFVKRSGFVINRASLYALNAQAEAPAAGNHRSFAIFQLVAL